MTVANYIASDSAYSEIINWWGGDIASFIFYTQYPKILETIGGRQNSPQEKSKFLNHSNQQTYALKQNFLGTFQIGSSSSLHVMLIDCKLWTIGGGNELHKDYYPKPH